MFVLVRMTPKSIGPDVFVGSSPKKIFFNIISARASRTLRAEYLYKLKARRVVPNFETETVPVIKIGHERQ